MTFFTELFSNYALWASLLAWVVAQALKVVFFALVEHKWDYKRFFGLGGMPSSHSAVVCALSTSVGMLYGFNSPIFALCVVNALVVMTDAAGVRRAAGKQAAMINKIVQELLESGKGLSYETLKELLGHSPFEVLVGALLGIGIGVLVCQFGI